MQQSKQRGREWKEEGNKVRVCGFWFEKGNMLELTAFASVKIGIFFFFLLFYFHFFFFIFIAIKSLSNFFFLKKNQKHRKQVSTVTFFSLIFLIWAGKNNLTECHYKLQNSRMKFSDALEIKYLPHGLLI